MSEIVKKKLFQVAVLHHDKDGTTEVIPLKSVLAKDSEVARLAVIREVPAEWDEKLDELEILVRPF